MRLSLDELAEILHDLSLENHKKLLSHLSDLQEESRKHNPFTTWCIVVIIGIISLSVIVIYAMHLELIDSKEIVAICKIIGGTFAASGGVVGSYQLIKKKSS